MSPSSAQSFNPRLQEYAKELETGTYSIDAKHKQQLEAIADYILKARSEHGKCKLVFVCTHNSRRSHFAQVWMQTAAYYYGVEGISTYSGGTETTAANIRSMNALERAGFSVSKTEKEDGNHHYSVKQGNDFEAGIMFSKVFSNPHNPQENFAAVMVCSDADQNCPFVPGAEARISLPFDDPKAFDGTEKETEAYDATCRLIGTEMFYVMKLVKESL